MAAAVEADKPNKVVNTEVAERAVYKFAAIVGAAVPVEPAAAVTRYLSLLF